MGEQSRAVQGSAPGGIPSGRSDYASTRTRRMGAWIASVDEGSPADDAGLEAGMRVDTVNGVPLRDLIDWRWEADGELAALEVFVPEDGEVYLSILEREPGQDWGIDFTDVLFDGIRTCVNACLFCFMRMLPPDARDTLLLRDDDYRLSFLQGNFVTLTNVSDEDVERIIRCRLEPMNVSIHAISPEVRRPLIGPHERRGIEVLEQLCAAGIEVHGQIVLCPGLNDGEELVRTLDWVEAHPEVTSLALVPMGYTKHSKLFDRSFSEDIEASRAVVRTIEPYQRRARESLGITRFQLSDEFYLDAHLQVPPAETYDGYPQFYDGIGMLRSFLDEIDEVLKHDAETLLRVACQLERCSTEVLLVCGEAASGVMDELCTAWATLCSEGSCPIKPLAIRNDYYGGDVNVTGLIVSCDLLAQLPFELANTIVVLPEVMFNFDRLTLDGDHLDHIEEVLGLRGATVIVCQCSPRTIVEAIARTV